MSTRVQESLLGFSFKPQTDIETANVDADFWRATKLNQDPINPEMVKETDAEEMGKGDEFIRRVFKSHWNVGAFTWDNYLNTQMLAWLGKFCLGNSAKTGPGPDFTYTSSVADAVTLGLERPYFTVVEQVRPGGGPVTDFAYPGCAVDSFEVQIESGPGRASGSLTFTVVGSGRNVTPSTITLPTALLDQKEIKAATLAMTVLGKDYVLGKQVIRVNFGFANNFTPDETGFFPGSGEQDGAAVRGRIEHGTRQAILSFVVRKDAASDEKDKVKNQTVGTATIAGTHSTTPLEDYLLTYHEIEFLSANDVNVNGLLGVEVTCAVRRHTTNGLLTLVTHTQTDAIGE